MAIPTFVSAGTTRTGAGAIANLDWGLGHQADDFAILPVETAAQVPANNPPSGWFELPGSPQTTGTPGAAGATRLSVYGRYALSSAEPDGDIGDSGDHQMGKVFVFRGVDLNQPWDVTAGDVEPATVTAIAIPGQTTTVPECLVVAIATNATDIGTDERNGALVNADLGGVVARASVNTAAGVGGGIYVITGTKALAGLFGITTGNFLTATKQARLVIALRPPQGGLVQPVVILSEGY